MQEVPEKIIDLLKKIKDMAEREDVEPGVRAAAQNRLKHIMEQYNITEDELNIDDEVEHELKFKFDTMTGNIIYSVIRAYTTDEQELYSRQYSRNIASIFGFSTHFKLKISRRHFIDIDVAIKYYLDAFKKDLKPIRKEHLNKKKQQLRRQKLDRQKCYWLDEQDLNRTQRIARGNLKRKLNKEIKDFCNAFCMKHKLYRTYKPDPTEDKATVEAAIESDIKEAGKKPLTYSEVKRIEREHQNWLKARSRVNSETLRKPIDLLNEENPLMLEN